MIKSHGAKVTEVPGSRDHCADVCRAKVRDEHVFYANHVFNPFFYEGMKAYIYETFEQLGRIPANIVVPVGNGTLYIGVVKALEHLLASGVIDKFPQIIALQSEKCDPLFRAVEMKAEEPIEKAEEPIEVEVVDTMAEGIAIGKPSRGHELLEMAYKHNIRFVTAPEDKILEARAKLASRGIYCEHTTAANYAAYLHYCEQYGPTPDTLITMCGAGIKSDH